MDCDLAMNLPEGTTGRNPEDYLLKRREAQPILVQTTQDYLMKHQRNDLPNPSIRDMPLILAYITVVLFFKADSIGPDTQLRDMTFQETSNISNDTTIVSFTDENIVIRTHVPYVSPFPKRLRGRLTKFCVLCFSFSRSPAS